MNIQLGIQTQYSWKVTEEQLNCLLYSLGFKSIQDRIGAFSIEQDGSVWGLYNNSSNTFVFFTDIP